VGELEIGGQGPLFAAVNIDAVDQGLDSPSRNYAVMTDDWAVAATQTMFTVSEGGLRLETSGIGGRFAGSTLMFDAGQWAFEATHTVMSAGRSYRAVGVGSQDWFTDGDFNNNDAFFYQEDGTVWDGSAWVAYGAAWSVNDVIRTEVDYANGTIEWFKNDVSQGRLNVSFNPISYAAGVYSGGNGSDSITLDFGQHGFTHTPTAGFQALTAQNLDGTTFGDPIVTPTEGHDSIEGTAEADTIDGLSGDDQLIGNEGADILYGVSGDDRLLGGDGADRLYGGAGDDVILGDAGGDTLGGGAGDDTLSGGDDDDVMAGDAGHDVLSGGGGSDSLDGGAGDDILAGGAGNDELIGGEGLDTADYLDAQADVSVDLSQTTVTATVGADHDTLSGIENVIGSAHGDTLTGDGGANVFDGNAGDDTLAGGSGGDTLDGGDGSDTASYEGSWSGVSVNLSTGQGSGGHAQGDALSNIENVEGSDFDDALTGDAGVNTLSGGDGDDVLAGGAGGDRLIGGLGSDTAGYQDSDSAVTIDLQADTAAGGHATGDDLDGIENLIGSDHADTLTGDGNDNVLTGGAGGDTLTGGLGSDTVSYSGSDAGVTVDLLSDTATGGHASGDDLDGIENLTGSGHDDTLTGDGGDNILAGGAGNDVLTGGAGIDAADYQDSQGAVTVDLSQTDGSGNVTASVGSDEQDVLNGIEDVIGSAYGDLLTGDDGVNVLDGGSGSDTLTGGAGGDILSGGSGDYGDYTITGDDTSATVTDTNAADGDDGADSLDGVEHLQFADRTIHLDGTNNAVDAFGDGNAINEDVTVPVTGNVLDNDDDFDDDALNVTSVNGDTANVGQALSGLYGDVTIHADGTYSYALDNTKTAIQALADGVTVTDTFTYDVADGFGGTDQATLTITITGTNDVPVIGGVTTGDVTEDGTLTASGLLTISDADAGQSVFQAATNVAGSYGSLDILADGNWTYSLTNTDPAVQGLAAGATLTDTIAVQSFDGTSQDIVVTITGTNDVPVIGGVSTGDVTEDGTLTASGLLTITDADAGQSVFQAATNVAGSYGSLDILTDGNWTYSLTNTDPAVQGLAAGATLTDTITVYSADGTSQDIVVTITGTNDVPVIGGVSTGDVTEDGTLTASGLLTITDADAGQSVFQAATNVAGSYGSLDILTDGNWTYSLTNTDPAVQGLAAGATLTDTITVYSADGTSQDIVVTITGTNDAPVIGGVSTSDVTEDGTLTASGLLTITDADAGQSVFQAATNVAGSYGSLDILADGNWTYSLTNTDPAVQGLAAGATLIDTIAVQSFDGTSQDIVVTITGTNDGPVAVADAASVAEDTLPNPISGNLLTNDTDVDGDSLIVSAVTGGTVGQAIAGSFGSVIINGDGGYVYTLDNTNSAVQALGVGASLTETFTYEVSDGNGGTDQAALTITIDGTNDAPVIGGISTGDVTEDGTLTARGLLTISDVDTDESAFQAATGIAGNYGSLDILANGNWTYSLDNADPAVQGLAAGTTLSDVVTVHSVDGTGQDIVVTITGTNDGPIVVNPTAGSSVDEDTSEGIGGPASFYVLGGVSDPDGDALTVTAVSETSSTGVALTVTPTGDYEYDAVNGYEGADSFDFRVTDSATGVSSTATVDVGVGFPGYAIDNSISLDGSSESLSMTPTSAGNQKTWTWSGWVKPASVGANNVIWSVGSVGRAEIMFNPSGQLFASFDNSNSTQLVTSASFADSTKWTHVAFAVDTTQGAASERLKLYIDGTEVSSFSQANYPGQDAVGNVNSSLEHRVGYDLGTYFDGSVAETALVDGLALDASSFGKFDGSGNWVPKDVSGLTYGTNGFHLDFADGADLGNDVSGNNRDFAGTNIDASDQSFDSPTDNFVTLDPSFSGGLTLSDGNLVARSDGVTSRAVGTTAIPLDATGQYYFAGEITGQGSGSHPFYIGIQAASGEGAGGTNQLWYRAEIGEIQDEAATWTSYGSSFTVGDEVGVLVDMDADTVTFYKNGVSQGVAFDNISTRLSSAFLPKFKTNNISGDEWTAKFGAQGYKYPAPVGAKTLSSAEMSDAYVGNPIVTPTSGNDSIEGTAEADTIDGLAGDDQLIGQGGDDTLSGNDGDDLLIGGEGDDTLSGGAGDDTASYADNISGYTVSYDSATDTITVTDTDTSNGDEGSDTITGVESFDFNGTTLTKADLEAAPTATDSAAQLSKDGVADWTLTGSGTGTLSYAVENGGAAIDTTVATGLGFDTLAGDVFATTHGHVQVQADGGYEYRPNTGYEGADSFDFRVTDDATGVSSVATVDVGVGFPGYEIANSVNLNGTDEYLSFTPSSGDPSTRFTFSGWVKRNSLGEQIIISSGDNSSERAAIKFTSVENGNKLQMHADSAAQGQYLQLQSDIAIDTVGEWVHIYVAIDSTQAVVADRVVMAVNGTQVGYSQETWFGQNTTMQWGNAVAHHIGDQSYDGINSMLVLRILSLLTMRSPP